MEVEIEEYTAGSLGGGGRYDELMGIFAGTRIPAVGFAFGFDRIIEAMDEFKLFPESLQSVKVLVTQFSNDQKGKTKEIEYILRENKINTEIYLNENTSLEKQLKYADKKGLPYVIIMGPEEEAKNVVILKNMITRTQKEITISEVITLLK